MLSKQDVEASAFFSAQMVVHLVRNLTASGLLNELATKTNIQETIDQATVHLGTEHHASIVAVAQAFEQAVEIGCNLRDKGKR